MKKHLLLLLALSCACASDSSGQTHSFITGPFKSGPEVTKTCMECHEKETKSFMKTVHWTWTKKQSVNGKSAEYGKRNALSSNFCSSLPSNWPGCTSCHAGYGWTDGAFDFGKAENVDCLVCHETTGTYRKFPTAAGHPVYPGETMEYPKGKVWEPVDLVAVAQSVGMPTRAACGSCHFYGGGGDGVKHGDLDSSLVNPAPDIDVHMGKIKLTCESCHQAANHDVRGEALSVSPGSGPRAMGCTSCHRKDVHKSAALNKHVSKVACQTCHIPTFARAIPTTMWWDWSSAGKEVKPEEIKKESPGDKLYDKTRGEMIVGKDLVPTYLWYNGSVDRVLLGEKIDPAKVVRLSAPRGERKDPDAKIFPFKVMKGKQPYDTQNRTVAVVNSYGPSTSETAYSVNYDWNKAIEAGMKAAGQPYSGKYGWIETSMAWSLNHMVAPKEKTLRCLECHGEKGRIDWKTLGYPRDPRGGGE
ncbi:MAG: cytochrome C [Geobacteraceae bacterium GWC2_58_44]|nr:MAG: cytochrome C [Geobacteraceae bacterium GWC2_58_44]HBG07373.1 cytochrome C [Geobacter sp.]